ncbi:SDR family oxidoreductase [Sediminicoccus rosea]|uniref:SDR family oxidoreductase n=1 Tax=Sediminicoccus rosea TaxID=1225128 RepID=A0ABZ0PDB8_9PROT|nr:SDR family oxidoreductase [Sediminicoccus rosea]WPB83516.1 SDR family oxidoreductase [Sediminicoccus rosea]
MLPIRQDIPRRALVTGGAKRLGRAICLALAEAGFDIAIHYNSSAAEAEALAEEIRAWGRQATTVQADLMREAEVGSLVARATGALGPLGVLVNNASTFERDEWHDATRESWDLHIEPNLRAPFRLMQDFARALTAPQHGVILNMLDQRVMSLTPHFVSYTVSKAGLWALTQQMALALAPRIRVVGIGPGPALPSPRQSQAQFERQCASVPLARGTSPAEIAAAVMALLSLSSVTGQVIHLDGGQHLQWSPAGGAAPEE